MVLNGTFASLKLIPAWKLIPRCVCARVRERVRFYLPCLYTLLQTTATHLYCIYIEEVRVGMTMTEGLREERRTVWLHRGAVNARHRELMSCMSVSNQAYECLEQQNSLLKREVQLLLEEQRCLAEALKLHEPLCPVLNSNILSTPRPTDGIPP